MPTVPLLASVADLSASVTAGGASQLVPSGVVMAYAGATAPTGWLVCNGAAVSQTTYPDLYAAIGVVHGNPGGGSFNLPNYQGRFLRGRANGATTDPDRAARSAAASGGVTGDAVGSVQSFATSIASGTTNKSTTGLAASTSGSDGTHTHGVNQQGDVFASNATTGGATSLINFGSTTKNAPTTNTSGSGHGHTVSITGDNESRPVNAYVNYIIKI